MLLVWLLIHAVKLGGQCGQWRRRGRGGGAVHSAPGLCVCMGMHAAISMGCMGSCVVVWCTCTSSAGVYQGPHVVEQGLPAQGGPEKAELSMFEKSLTAARRFEAGP